MLRRRASVVCIHQEALLVVYLEDPVSKITRPFLPGGEIEAHETPASAAIRETKEETGLPVQVDQATERQKQYPFFWAGAEVECLTFFYRATCQQLPQNGETHPVASAPIQDASYHRGVAWMPCEQVNKHFSYHPVILAEINAIMKA
jgi:8-oxo-dGTP pyrophosphatase MutT (NUDIX family)